MINSSKTESTQKSPRHYSKDVDNSDWRYFAKAIVAFITPIVVTLAATADNGWTTGELLTALAAALTTSAGVYATPNKK